MLQQTETVEEFNALLKSSHCTGLYNDKNWRHIDYERAKNAIAPDGDGLGRGFKTQIYLRGVRYRAERLTKAEAGAIGGASKGNESQEPCPCLTADKIAKEAGPAPRARGLTFWLRATRVARNGGSTRAWADPSNPSIWTDCSTPPHARAGEPQSFIDERLCYQPRPTHARVNHIKLFNICPPNPPPHARAGEPLPHNLLNSPPIPATPPLKGTRNLRTPAAIDPR